MSWRVGVVGSPVAHSLSPALQRAALATLGLSGTAEAVDVAADDRDGLVAAIRAHDALSVTMPHKALLVQIADEVDEVARRTESANTVRVHNGRIEARSTDGAGFCDAVSEAGVVLGGATVVVRGAGGASRAIVDALVSHGARSVAVCARSAAAAQRLGDQYGAVVVNPVAIDEVSLIVNTIPTTDQSIELAPCEVLFTDDALAVDIVYSPPETAWLASERLDGRRTMNGLAMLVHQARHQFEWWFNTEVPIAPLWEAVR